jgi:copper resistance protein C
LRLRPSFKAGAIAVAEGDELFAAIYRRIPVLLLVLVVAGTTQLCWAHAILMDSTPKLNTTVKGPDVNINLRFNVRIDGGRSRVLLVSPGGKVSPLTLAGQATPDTLQTHATGLQPGAYKLQWKVLASDGHMSSGEIPFTVN